MEWVDAGLNDVTAAVAMGWWPAGGANGVVDGAAVITTPDLFALALERAGLHANRVFGVKAGNKKGLLAWMRKGCLHRES